MELIMRRALRIVIVLSVVLTINSPITLQAAGGTSIVAQKGQPAYMSPRWPEGTKDLVNSPLRTTGWNSWFSE